MAELILVFLFGLILYTFAGYPLLLVLLGKMPWTRTVPAAAEDGRFRPSVAVFIMTYNEERSIAKKIENTCDQDYPDMQVYVVDSASSDQTASIAAAYDGVTVLRQSVREGKAAAVNFALQKSKEEIIIVTDANALFSQGAVSRLVAALVDPRIAAATGRFRSQSDSSAATARGEGWFWLLEDVMRRRESQLDSVIGVSGEITAFRRSALGGGLDAANLTEDFEMAVRLRRTARVVYVPEAVATEPPALTVGDQITQKKRRVIGTLMTLRKHKNMLFNPRFGWYGLLILPSHKLLPMLSPFLLLAALLLTALLSLGSIFWLIILGLEVIGIALGVLGLYLQLQLLAPFSYFLELQIIVLLGWRDYVRKNYRVTWDLIASTRQ